jgi:AcrR family transcriptional regulator
VGADQAVQCDIDFRHHQMLVGAGWKMITEIAEQKGRAAKKKLRRDAILEVAGRYFLEYGFVDTTMSAIAAACCGSKSTLWNYFSSKDKLFVTYLDSNLDQFGRSLSHALAGGGGTAATLRRVGIVFLDRVLSKDGCALRQLIVSEGRRFPELAQAFFVRGPAAIRDKLTFYITDEMASGRLKSGDPETVARQFLALCQSGWYADVFWYQPGPCDIDIAVAHDVENALRTFLEMWEAKI